MNYNPFLSNHFNSTDRLFTRLHKEIYLNYRWKVVIICLGLYFTVILLFADALKISCNYFVLLPLMASAIAYGLPGGLTAGILSLPMNLLLFRMIDHCDYAPESLFIAFCSGSLIGLVMGYLSDYFHKLINEVDRRLEIEKELRDSLTEKDLLMREINHRVRNNLGIISSLIQLQSNRVNESYFTEEFEKLKQRVFSISLVHEQLFIDNQAHILDMKSYLVSLVHNLLNTSDELDIQLIINEPSGPLFLDSDKVLHLGLIVQEIVMNSIKYAFTLNSKGILRMNLKEKDGFFIVDIQDSGKGFNSEQVVQGLGIRLIKSLSVSLEGQFSWNNDNGCQFILKIPSK